MNVIFLDIDGVLNNRESMAHGVELDPDLVLGVNAICKACGADIVISSTWRIIMDLDVLRLMLRRVGLRWGEIMDVTPRIDDECRGYEIREWMRRQPETYTHYVILDDDRDMLREQAEHFVHVDGEKGLTGADVEKAIAILGGRGAA